MVHIIIRNGVDFIWLHIRKGGCGFSPLFCHRFSVAPNQHHPLWDLWREPPNTTSSPLPRCASPHPLQNRVPRVQVLLPLPQNRRKHWVFAGFLFFMCCMVMWCIWVQILGFPTCPHRLHPSPAPKTHPVSPFSDDFGCVSLFLPSFDLQNFRAGFCASCRIVVTS